MTGIIIQETAVVLVEVGAHCSSFVVINGIDEMPDVMRTLLVLDSKTKNMMVYLFVKENESSSVVLKTSMFALEPMTASGRVSAENAVLLLGVWQESETEAPLQQSVVRKRLSIVLVDRKEGVVQWGNVECEIDIISFLFTPLSTRQSWTEVWEFNTFSFYHIQSVISQFSVVAVQSSSFRDTVSENINNGTVTFASYDVIRIHVLSGRVEIIRFEANFTEAQLQISSMDNTNRHLQLLLNKQQTLLSLYDSIHDSTLMIAKIDTWTQYMDAANGSRDNVLQMAPSPSVLISEHHLVEYRDIFQASLVFFVDTSTYDYGVVRIRQVECTENARADSTTFFRCACRAGYKADPAWEEHGGNIKCVACAVSSFCPREFDLLSTGCAAESLLQAECLPVNNITKCPPGYKQQKGGCVLCGDREYCFHGQGFACPSNSGSLLVRGASEAAECVCLPGYFQANLTERLVCHECAVPFFCAESRQQHCMLNMATNVSKASSNRSCECVSGFYRSQTNAQETCSEIPIGSWSSKDSPHGLQKCPSTRTTRFPRSTAIDDCVCSAGFRENNTSAYTDCVSCVGQEVCPVGTGSHETVTFCTKYKQIANHQHDACVCTAGFYDFRLNLLEDQSTKRSRQDLVCVPCALGYYCPFYDGIVQSNSIVKCPYKMTSMPGTTSKNGCFCEQSDHTAVESTVAPFFELECRCPDTHYETEYTNICVLCPPRMYVPLRNKILNTFGQASCECQPGFFKTDAGPQVCAVCPPGHFCPRETRGRPRPCPHGSFGPATGQSNIMACLQCPKSFIRNDTGVLGASTSQLQDMHVQGSVVDCFSVFVPIYTNRPLLFTDTSFIFVVRSGDVQTHHIVATVARIFNFRSLLIEAIASVGQIQYTIKLTKDFFEVCLHGVSKMSSLWGKLRASSPEAPTLYLSFIRHIFCDTMLRIAVNLYGSHVFFSACYLPMDRHALLGETLLTNLRLLVEKKFLGSRRAPSALAKTHKAENHEIST